MVRKIEGELVVVPLAGGIGDLENELNTLNDTGQAVSAKLDGAGVPALRHEPKTQADRG